jgi:hypothetical protein
MSAFRLALTNLIALSTLLSTCNAALAANSFVYAVPTPEHAGKFNGEMPVDRIGHMLLPRGLASFAADELQIRAVPQWMFDRNAVLKGVIVRAEGAAQSNGGFVLGGLVIMLDGLWLDKLAKANEVESIDTTDGAVWKGRILGRINDSLNFQHTDGKAETITFSKIKTISSSRAFTFNINADGVKISPADSSMSFEAKQIVLKANRKQHVFLSHARVPKSDLPGTEQGISKTALATFIGLDMISTLASPIAIPLVLNAKNQRAAKNRIAQATFQNFTSALQNNAPTPAPTTGNGM